MLYPALKPSCESVNSSPQQPFWEKYVQYILKLLNVPQPKISLRDPCVNISVGTFSITLLFVTTKNYISNIPFL